MHILPLIKGVLKFAMVDYKYSQNSFFYTQYNFH